MNFSNSDLGGEMDAYFTWESLRDTLKIYLLVEVIFILYSYFVIIPRVHNETVKHRDITDSRFKNKRHKLLLRILQRFKSFDQLDDTTEEKKCGGYIHKFEVLVESYFLEKPLEIATKIGTIEELNRSAPSKSFCDLYRKENIDEFLCWAFFCKHVHEMSKHEMCDLDQCYNVLKQEVGFKVKHGRSNLSSVRLNFDRRMILPRPLSVYALSQFSEFIASQCLKFCRFKRYTSRNGLCYWFRGERNAASKEKNLPLLFFHGISPVGYALYLRFFLSFVQNLGGPAFLFESPHIAMKMTLEVLSEGEMVEDVLEAINTQVSADCQFRIVAHSFGTFAAAWLNRSVPQRIKELILLDPVSISISTSNVNQKFNFSYGLQKEDFCLKRLSIFITSTTEISIQNYFRHYFLWYNAELFLEEISPSTDLIIHLSKKDCILDYHVVEEEINRFKRLRLKSKNQRITTLLEENHIHGEIVFDSTSWTKIFDAVSGIEPMNERVTVTSNDFDVSKEELAVIRSSLVEKFARDSEFLSDAYLLSVASKPYSKDPTTRRPLEYTISKLFDVMKWRQENGAAEIPNYIELAYKAKNLSKHTTDPLLKKAQRLAKVLNTGSMYWHGLTKQGQPILWIRTDRKPWYPDVDAEIMALIALTDAGIRGMPNAITSFVAIADSTAPPPPNPEYMIKMMKALVKGYPDRLGLLVSSPISGIVQFVTNLLLPMMPGQLSSKLHLMGRENAKEKLCDVLNEEDIPKFMGGNADHDIYYPIQSKCSNKENEILTFDWYGMINRLASAKDTFLFADQDIDCSG